MVAKSVCCLCGKVSCGIPYKINITGSRRRQRRHREPNSYRAPERRNARRALADLLPEKTTKVERQTKKRESDVPGPESLIARVVRRAPLDTVPTAQRIQLKAGMEDPSDLGRGRHHDRARGPSKSVRRKSQQLEQHKGQRRVIKKPKTVRTSYGERSKNYKKDRSGRRETPVETMGQGRGLTGGGRGRSGNPKGRISEGSSSSTARGESHARASNEGTTRPKLRLPREQS